MKKAYAIRAALSAAIAATFVATAFRMEWILRPVHPSSIYRQYMPRLAMIWLACIAIGLCIAYLYAHKRVGGGKR